MFRRVKINFIFFSLLPSRDRSDGTLKKWHDNCSNAIKVTCWRRRIQKWKRVGDDAPGYSLPHKTANYGALWSVVNYQSGVWGGTSAEISFGAVLTGKM